MCKIRRTYRLTDLLRANNYCLLMTFTK